MWPYSQKIIINTNGLGKTSFKASLTSVSKFGNKHTKKPSSSKQINFGGIY